MEVLIGKSKWEMWDDSLESFLTRAKGDAFSAVEIYLKSLKETVPEILSLLHDYNMLLVGQILTEGKTYKDHIDSLKEQFEFAYKLSPQFINTHAGRDIFSFEENVIIFNTLIKLSNESGLPIYVETHRGRPTYSAIETIKYLQQLPALELTADFSHWTVVHESDLSDQSDTISMAIERSRYIHARPGYQEGPQISDPRAPEWKYMIDLFLTWWQGIIDSQTSRQKELLIITPEFGPPGYMHTMPFTNKPISDVWEMNVVMKEIISEHFLAHKNNKAYS